MGEKQQWQQSEARLTILRGSFSKFTQTKSNNYLKMSKIFSWEYFSFVTLDDSVLYKEALVVPAVIFILSVVWMQLVKGKTSEESQKEQTKRDINFEQAYMDAKLNEVDSGTELDSQGEEERRRLVKRTKPKSLSLPRMRRRRKKINVTVIFVCTEFHPASTFPLIHEFILTEDV